MTANRCERYQDTAGMDLSFVRRSKQSGILRLKLKICHDHYALDSYSGWTQVASSSFRKSEPTQIKGREDLGRAQWNIEPWDLCMHEDLDISVN
jgi:hypothetical protein